MLLKTLVSVATLAVALSEEVESGSLRGPSIALAPEKIQRFGNQESGVRKQERALNQIMSKLYEGAPAASEKANGKSELDYSGGKPKLSYDGFVVTRQYTNKDCSGEVESVVGKDLSCRYVGRGRYIRYDCQKTSDRERGVHGIKLTGYVYYDSQCEGEGYIYYNEMNVDVCDGQGMSMRCVPREDTFPTFAKRDGLFTYKFEYNYECTEFGNQYLGYSPRQTYLPKNDLDDDYYSYDDDNNYDDGEGGGSYGYGMIGRRHLSVEERETRTKENLASPNVDSVDAPASKHTMVSEGEFYREYGFSQQTNGVCAFDEKFQLWVKTTCNGAKNTLTYFVFADRHCHKAIKRVVHPLDQMIPYYGYCVSSFHDQRTTLTVCHNGALQTIENDDFGGGGVN